MHGRNRVFSQPALDEAPPGGGAGASMRPFWRIPLGPPSLHNAHGNSSNDPSGHHELGVHATTIHNGSRMHSSPFSWRVGPGAPPLWSLTNDWKELPADNVVKTYTTVRRVAGWQTLEKPMVIKPRITLASLNLFCLVLFCICLPFLPFAIVNFPANLLKPGCTNWYTNKW